MWSQVFSFFVHSVAAEQLHLKVCLKLAPGTELRGVSARVGREPEQVPWQ